MNTKIWTPDQETRALSWKEPFASLMLHGKIETRNRPTKVRGWVLICSALKGYNLEEFAQISGEQIMRTVSITEPISNIYPIKTFGKAIALGYLSDCRPMTKEDEDACFVRYREGLWCWIFTDVTPITPVKWKGKQGWSILTPEQKQLIKPITNHPN